jgi:hypothetical protein
MSCKLTNPRKNVSIAAVIHGVAIVLVKIAILLQYNRIFVARGSRNWLFWTSHVIIWLQIAFYLTYTLLEVFACRPRAKLWSPWLPGKCLDTFSINIAAVAFNVATDILILLIPQKVIWGLRLSTKRKVQISLIFLVAIL